MAVTSEKPAERIGGYRILRRLATGGTSDVLLAKAEGPHGFERTVVLKLLLSKFRDDESFSRMFAREAAAYARLSHPAVVRLFDFFQNNEQLVMVLEYVDGPPLNKLRSQLKQLNLHLDDRASIYVATRLFAALAAAHAARDPETGEYAAVIHRDVNPSNVLITWDGHVKLTDFGIAKVAGIRSDTQVGLIKGTYGYMAPEQVKGETVTPRADVYAAAIVLWEMLARRKAIQPGALPEVEILRAMAEPHIVSLDAIRADLDKNVRDAIRRALMPNADKRSITAEEMVGILREAVPSDLGRESLAGALERAKPRPSERAPSTGRPAKNSSAAPPPRSTADSLFDTFSPEAATKPRADSKRADVLSDILGGGGGDKLGSAIDQILADPGPTPMTKRGLQPQSKAEPDTEQRPTMSSDAADETLTASTQAPKVRTQPFPQKPPSPSPRGTPMPSALAQAAVAALAHIAQPPPLGKTAVSPTQSREAREDKGPTKGTPSQPSVRIPAAKPVGTAGDALDRTLAMAEAPPIPGDVVKGSLVQSLPTPIDPKDVPTIPAPSPLENAMLSPVVPLPPPLPALAATVQLSSRGSPGKLPPGLPPMPPPGLPPSGAPSSPSARSVQTVPPAAMRAANAKAAPKRRSGVWVAVILVVIVGAVGGGGYGYARSRGIRVMSLLHGAPAMQPVAITAPTVTTPAASTSITSIASASPSSVASASASSAPSASAAASASAVPLASAIASAAPSASPSAAASASTKISSTAPPASVAPAVSAAPAASQASAAPASSAMIPGDMSALSTAAAHGGHRIFVDDKVIGETPNTIQVPCGKHTVRIGSAGTPQDLTLPCGDTISVK